MTRRYTAELIEFIGPEKDVPAPDMNTNEQTMAWMMDTYSMHMRQTVTAVVTGKPLNIGGSRGRREATGRGVHDRLRRVAQEARTCTAKTRASSCRASATSARTPRCSCTRPATRSSASAKSTAACTTTTASTSTRLSEYRQTERHDPRLQGSREAHDPAELLITDCEILIPAATENVITSRNADQVKAQDPGRGRQRPDHGGADDILADKDVFVIPTSSPTPAA